MKKFEQHLRQKAHLTKIKNAKQTVQAPNKHTSRIGSSKGDEAQLLLSLYDNKSFDSIPAYKLLRTAGLQQYTREFIERGYGINLGKLGLLTDKDRQKLYQDLKILPGHTVKLDNLINKLTQLTIDKQSNIFDQSEKQTISHQALSETGKPVRTNNYKQTNSIKSIRKQQANNIMLKNQADINYEQQLERVLNEYTPAMDDKKKRTFNEKISERNSVQLEQQKKYSKTRYNPPSTNKFIEAPGSQFKKKTMDSKPTVKRGVNIPLKTTNLKILQKRRSTGTTPEISSKLYKNRDKQIKKEDYIGISTERVMDIDLGINKIKCLYRSFEGALMGSTIVNIDIQQLVYAFSGLIQKRVIAAPQPIKLNQIQNFKKKESIKQQKQRYLEEGDIEDEVGQILRQSYLHPLYRNQDVDIDEQIDQNLNDQELVESQGEQQQIIQIDNNSNQFMEPKTMEQSSLFGESSYDFGLNNSLDIFNEPTPTQLDYFKPSIDSIANFIKNIVLAAKMERQIPIMAAYYIQTFIHKTQILLTSLNYKRILVSVLLLASKIWDDQSFESPSFARTFPQYTTILLNEMEKQILKALDYHLKLDKKEYSEMFFRMRQFAKKNNRSCQNKRLNLKQIRQLQHEIKRQYRTQFHQKKNSF